MSRVKREVVVNWLDERRLDQAHELRRLIEMDRVSCFRYDGEARQRQERLHARAWSRLACAVSSAWRLAKSRDANVC